MTNALDHPIATRRLRLFKHGRTMSVTVKLGMPYRAEPGEWVCPYRISGSAARVKSEARGIDSFQALALALESIRINLKKIGGKISWEGEANDAGFPRYVPSYFGREFSHQIGRIIDREVMRFGRAAKARKG